MQYILFYVCISYITVCPDFYNQSVIMKQGECVQFFTVVTKAVMSLLEHLSGHMPGYFLRRSCQMRSWQERGTQGLEALVHFTHHLAGGGPHLLGPWVIIGGQQHQCAIWNFSKESY